MKAPPFWWRPEPTLLATLLRPAGAIYGSVTAARMARTGARASTPVICIGNLVAGGAGKTPVAIAIARLLQSLGRHPAFLSRGYGRTEKAAPDDVHRVDPTRDDARRCGDEPLLLAAVAPTFVSANRLAAARQAVAAGADILVLDDGLQNPALTKDFAIAVVDGRTGIGNGLCVPAGPLRAPAHQQWPFVSLVCVIGEGQAGRQVGRMAEQAGKPVLTARIVPDPNVLAQLRGKPLFGFAGIGRPEKFYATLREHGLSVVGQRSFADHHIYSAADIVALTGAAAQAGAVLVTTGKDRVRLPEHCPAVALPIELIFNEADTLLARLAAL